MSNVYSLKVRQLEKELVRLCIALRDEEFEFQQTGNELHANRMEDITDDIIWTVDELIDLKAEKLTSHLT